MQRIITMLTNIRTEISTIITNNRQMVAFAVIFLIVGRRTANKIEKIVDKSLTKSKMDISLKKFVDSLIGVLLKIGVIIITAEILGIQSTSFLAIFGAAGLAIGLALQGSLSNFASGVMILFFKPYKIGDFITANSETGTVQDIEIFNTTILTPENKTIIIPNSLITAGNITNNTRHGSIRVDIKIGISYDADLQETKNILTKIISDHNLVLSHNGNGVFVNELGDSSVNLIIRGYAKPQNYRTVFFDLTESSKIALDQNNIEIPYPHQVVHMYNK